MVPCPSVSDEPPATKIAIKAAPMIPKTGAVKLNASIPIEKYELKTSKSIAIIGRQVHIGKFRHES